MVLFVAQPYSLPCVSFLRLFLYPRKTTTRRVLGMSCMGTWSAEESFLFLLLRMFLVSVTIA